MVIKETATEQYALVDFGNDWDFTVGVETFDLFTKDVQDEAFEKAEKIIILWILIMMALLVRNGLDRKCRKLSIKLRLYK